jgi:very-short-patch-repair endonuclease
VPAKNLVIQVDGRMHYLKDPEGHRHQRPQDLRMDEVLKAMDYEVLRVGFSKFDAP